MKIHLYLFFIIYFLFGFSFTLLPQNRSLVNVNYINRYSNLAIRHRDKYKIPASITLAQGILESGAGTSHLAVAANNHFGIKCHLDWKGERIYRPDDGPNDCFRKYKTVDESFEDHSKFLLQPRYKILFTYKITDYWAWSEGLQACKYATDQNYANKLIRIIEEYELYKYDIEKSSKTTTPAVINTTPAVNDVKATPKQIREIYKTHNLIYVIAKDSDSFNQIAFDTGFKAKDLIKYNDVPENITLKKGDIIYLQKKKSKADIPYFEHLIKPGESMHRISQQYGIQLNNLYKMNKKNSNYVPIIGEVLRLR